MTVEDRIRDAERRLEEIGLSLDFMPITSDPSAYRRRLTAERDALTAQLDTDRRRLAELEP